MVIVCDNCGRENEDEFKFCLGCGSELSPPEPEEDEDDEPGMVDCPHCGSRVPGEFKFCGQCGGSLEDVGADSGADEADEPVESNEPVEQSEQVQEPRQQSPDTVPSATAGAQEATADAEESTSATRLGELTVIRPDGTEGANIPLTTSGLMLGRESDFEVLAEDGFLSPRHAEIRHDDGELYLEDLDSTNGVFWRLSDDVELQHGDMLRVGQELLRFEDFDEVDSVDDRGVDGEVRVQGSPDPGIWGRLVLVGGPDVDTRAFALSGDGATIGREIGAILFQDDGFVSGKHAKIYRDEGSVYFRDLGSSNGSYIRIQKERRIGHGDLVLMGQQLLRVTLER